MWSESAAGRSALLDTDRGGDDLPDTSAELRLEAVDCRELIVLFEARLPLILGVKDSPPVALCSDDLETISAFRELLLGFRVLDEGLDRGVPLLARDALRGVDECDCLGVLWLGVSSALREIL